MRGSLLFGWCAAFLSGALYAQETEAKLRVTVSIAPAHSLVAQVMAGVGEPSLLMPAGASPHHFSMRPSDARALHRADVVFWVGPGLEGWMSRPVASLSKKTKIVALSQADGVTRLKVREGGVWEGHRHDHHGEEGGAHKDQDQHGHDQHGQDQHGQDQHGHEKHGHDRHGDEKHSHGHHAHHEVDGHKTASAADFAIDQHFWLDPRNAAAWIEQITRVLVARDPANAERYKANAVKALQDIAALETEIETTLSSVRKRPFIVFHDAYRHFEDRFGLKAVGSIALPDAGAPGPARLAEIRKKIQASGAICVFTEPQLPAKMARLATDGTEARIGELDPLGANIAPGGELYGALMMSLASGLRDCLGA